MNTDTEMNHLPDSDWKLHSWDTETDDDGVVCAICGHFESFQDYTKKKLQMEYER